MAGLGAIYPVAEFDYSTFEREIAEMKSGRLDKVRAGALNYLSNSLRKRARTEIEVRYDRPKAFTVNGLFVWRAVASERSQMYAGVYFKDYAHKGNPAGRYLHPTITGTVRPHKGFERALIRAGFMLASEYASPARAAPLDGYGNVTGGLIKQMLSQLKIGQADQWETTASRDRKTRTRKATGGTYVSGRRFFVADGKGGLPRGVYYRSGTRKPVMVLFFNTTRPAYGKVFPFKQIMETHAMDNKQRAFETVWKEQMVRPRKARGLQ